MPKVLVSDKLSEDVVAIFKSQGISVDYKPGMSAEELGREIHVRFQHNLKAIVTRCSMASLAALKNELRYLLGSWIDTVV